MGGVWCKADKGQRSYSPRAPFNTTISRWTDHMRQAYRKPKHHHRPPRPPQKPARSNERLTMTISAPTLVSEASSDGWRTATLVVPEVQVAPVPPPRKKRKRNMELNRTAVSMDDLNRGSADCLSKSTISLPDKCSSDTLDSRSSSTFVVSPILESRVNHSETKSEENKENINNLQHKSEEEDEDVADHPAIVPIEKETLFTSRTLLHSNLGYVDKLSAISEVSAESGFDDKTDVIKYSEGSSVTSGESASRETELNILAHIHNINNVSHIKESVDMREKTAVSKKEWLQNILTGDPEPYLMSRDASKEFRRGSEGNTKLIVSEDITEQPSSLPNHLHLMNREMQIPDVEIVNKTFQSTSEDQPQSVNSTNHSVLLGIIQNHKEAESEPKPPDFLDHREESIFLTNTKTNIVYKSLSSDNLTDDYDTCYSSATVKTIPKLSESVNVRRYSMEEDELNGTGKTHLSDYSFQTPKLVESDSGLNSLLEDKRSNVISSFDFKEIKNSKNYEVDSHHSNPSRKQGNEPFINGVLHPNDQISVKGVEESKHNDKLNAKDTLVKKDSISSSRKSSITDSLHEFEMSIYDMLKESKKNENSSDDEDSLKTVK